MKLSIHREEQFWLQFDQFGIGIINTMELPGEINYFRHMNENSRSHHLVNLQWFKESKADIEEAAL